jgi:hypothetical protein
MASTFVDGGRGRIRKFLPDQDELFQFFYTGLPILLILSLAAWAGWNLWSPISRPVSAYAAATASFIGALTLSLMPFLICVVQTTTRSRQLAKLNIIEKHPLGETAYFRAARAAIDELRTPASRRGGYLAPITFYCMVLLMGFVLIFFGYYNNMYFGSPNPILGGMRLPSNWDWSHPDPGLAAYQRGTFAVVATAFIGSYVYALARLVDRVNNNDLYPVSLHYYAARTIIACFTAAVVRHTAGFLDVENVSALVLLGFITGLAPDLMIVWLARKGFQQIKIWHGKTEPEGHRPTSLPLLMIDDLTKEKIERLGELGIDSAQFLACQNPFLLWIRLPYDLGILTDWIAQAQLYAFVREEKLETLREIYVNDIFDLYTRLCANECSPAISSVMGVDEACAPVLAQQLKEDQSFSRLREVRDALLKKPAKS